MYPVSARFLDAIGGSHRAVVRVQVLPTTPDNFPQFGPSPVGGTELPLLDGDVKLTSTADVNGSVDFTISGDYWDLLQPYGAELFVQRGVDFGDGTRELVPCGYYGIEEIDQDSAPAGPVKVSGADRSRRLARNRVIYPVEFPAGTTHTTIFQRLVNGVTPTGEPLKNYAMFLNAAVPITWAGYDPDQAKLGTSLVCEDDAHAFLAKLADARGCVLRFDRLGRLLVQPRNLPPGATPVYTVRPGAGGNLVSASRRVTRDGVYNYVVARGSDPANPTGYRLAWNGDTASPLRWFGPFGVVPRYYASPLILSNDAADAAAETVLARYKGLPSSLALLAVPNPALDPLDVVAATIGASSATHLVDQVAIPLVGAQPVEIVTRTLNEVPADDDTGGGGGGFPNPGGGTGGGGGGGGTGGDVDLTTAAGRLNWGAPLSMSDEFTGSTVDAAKWSVYNGPGHDGNGRRLPARVAIVNGVLTLTGLENGDSAGLAHRLGQRYGRWEIRARSFPTPGGGGSSAGVPVGTNQTFADSWTSGVGSWTSVQTHSYEGSASGYSLGSEYRMNVVNAGADHTTALRTEVRDGDTAVGSHERCELSSFGKSWNDQRNDERWYEFDVRFGDPTWSPGMSSSDDWLIFFQWHQPIDDGSPALAMSVHNDGKVYFEREPDSDFEFIEAWTVRPGVWEHVVVHIKWSPDSSVGFIECHVNDAVVVTKRFCKTQYSGDYNDYYVKLGQYRRSSVSGTTVVMHDNLRISGPPATAGSSGSSGGASYHPVAIVWPDSDRWPEDGEFDFMENSRPGDDHAEAFLHYPHSASVSVQQEHATKSGVDLSQWHNFGFEWTSTGISGFLDGVQWFSYAGGAISGTRQNIQDMPSGHLTLQLDNFNGASGNQPATMEVDWVRVYTLTPQGTGTILQAAQLILARIDSGQSILEDWTWAGSPAVVGQHKDELQQLYIAATGPYVFPDDVNSGQVAAWLRQYISDTTGGGTGGLTTLPDILRLGKAAGLTKVNLGIDFLSGDGPAGKQGQHVDFDLATLEADFTWPGYADVRPDGAVRLTAYVGAATTPNSTHSRTEFRELGPNGVDKASWSSSSGEHYVWVKGAVIRKASGRPHVVLAQIHDSSDDVATIRMEGTTVVATYGDSGRPGTLATGVADGSVHQWMLKTVRVGSTTVIQYFWDDMTTPKATQNYGGGSGNYFKAGVYHQSTTSYDDKGATFVADFYDMEMWHSGYAEPTSRH